MEKNGVKSNSAFELKWYYAFEVQNKMKINYCKITANIVVTNKY